MTVRSEKDRVKALRHVEGPRRDRVLVQSQSANTQKKASRHVETLMKNPYEEEDDDSSC
jgi:hypothetical protein